MKINILPLNDLELWEAIQNFNFDDQAGPYGFSIRLAHENKWSINFTSKAMLEYKKFMFLAATNSEMLSPSEIVDIVWHQHLIFTSSYENFCHLLGKKIQHIPSTHDKNQKHIFNKAKEYTFRIYKENFGQWPMDVWIDENMLDSLNLQPTWINRTIFNVLGILIALIFFIPLVIFLEPFYRSINNPWFIVLYLLFCITFYWLLTLNNKNKFFNILQDVDEDSFLFHLGISELIFLKANNMNKVIHGLTNSLISKKKIFIYDDYQIELTSQTVAASKEENYLIDEMKALHKSYYSALINNAAQIPYFRNIASSMPAVRDAFSHSSQFTKIYTFNFILLTVALLFGYARILVGILNERPVGFIFGIMVILTILIILHMNNLVNLFFKQTLIGYFKQLAHVSPSENEIHHWNYLFNGEAATVAAFTPLMLHIDNRVGGSSGDGSCGSCGSCGGCGGCGGCGS